MNNIKKYLKLTIIFQIINLFLITSCALKDFKNDNILFDTKKQHQLKNLTIPKGITSPNQDKEYNIPYEKEDLNKKSYNIFPPL
ncbi:outer membrane protein assembly factor BamC [Buchnera aphidicola (Brachycaudus cardui)]|uniref:Outer membrane protein assembly factor BamC n=1 Tax=Buchnera aphidicola (Brachycaudus cardui) TaxID=557993 RepID=A0A4D6Y2B6_9GAMM|nr:outer membrane protein assembly factor BamC [Buchnera aphidicola]QCI20250.1 outer membrane protein assembly factor BamC [Buchnera aphidicola (Brachycaudus cardui)]